MIQRNGKISHASGLEELILLKCPYWCRPGFLAFPNQQKLTRGQTRISGKALLGLLQAQEGAKTSNRFPCSLPERGWACFLHGVRVGLCSGVGPEGWLRCFAHPLVVLCTRGVRSTRLLFLTPCFCSVLFRSGSWVFCILSIICPNLLCVRYSYEGHKGSQFPLCLLLLLSSGVLSPGCASGQFLGLLKKQMPRTRHRPSELELADIRPGREYVLEVS